MYVDNDELTVEPRSGTREVVVRKGISWTLVLTEGQALGLADLLHEAAGVVGVPEWEMQWLDDSTAAVRHNGNVVGSIAQRGPIGWIGWTTPGNWTETFSTPEDVLEALKVKVV